MLSTARDRDISGISIARSSPEVSHLFFADDSLIFLKTSAAEFGMFKSILFDYERASKQCINLNKSMVCFSENVLVDTKSYLSSIFNMKVVSNLGSYFGLSSKFQRGKSKDFKFLLNKFWTLIGMEE